MLVELHIWVIVTRHLHSSHIVRNVSYIATQRNDLTVKRRSNRIRLASTQSIVPPSREPSIANHRENDTDETNEANSDCLIGF